SMLRLKLTAICAPSGHAGSGGCSPYPTRSRATMGSGFGSNMVGLRIRSPFLQEVSASTRPRQRCEAGIVAEEPIWLRGAVHPAVLDRNALHLGYAGNARRLITAVSPSGVVVTDHRQAAAEDRRILDGHRAPCGHVGAHRVTGIADQDDPVAAPGVVS